MKYVFDFGAVVFQWNPAQLLRRELAERVTDDASAQHWVAQFFQHYSGDWGEFDRGTVEPDALAQRIAARTGLTATEVQQVVDAVPDELQAKPDTVALIRRLHAAGKPLYYLSNMPVPYAQHLLQTHDFLKLFSDGVFSSSVHHNKPERAIFEIAAQRFGHPVNQLVFLDDSLPNVQAAQALGWNAVHFHSAAQAEAEMRERGWM